MILAVKLAGLAFGDFALAHLFIDPPVLVLQAVVDLGAPRVITHQGTLEDVFVALTGRHLREE